MKKEYLSPIAEMTVLSSNDVLLKSDVVLDGSGLFPSETDED